MLCMILLFAFSHASDDKISAPVEKVTTEEKVTFEWDAVTTYTNGKLIGKKDGKVKYEVYVYQAENKDEKPPKKMNIDKYKKKKKLKENPPIEKTSCEIRFEKNGLYFLGVQAILFKNGFEVKEGRSGVSWSCSKTCTNNKPKYVNVSK